MMNDWSDVIQINVIPIMPIYNNLQRALYFKVKTLTINWPLWSAGDEGKEETKSSNIFTDIHFLFFLFL